MVRALSLPLQVALPVSALVFIACGLSSFGTGEGGAGSAGPGGQAGSSSSGFGGRMFATVTSSTSASTAEGVGGGSVTASSSASGIGGATSTSSAGGGGSASSSSSSAGGEGGARLDGGAPPPLGAATSFAVLGGSTVTIAGVTTAIIGDLGVSPGTSITGIPVGMPVGTLHGSDAVSAQAQLDATALFDAFTLAPCDFDRPTAELGGLTLTPGVYCFGAAAVHLAGPLLLDAQGDPGARFVFKIAAALTTDSNASVAVINGGTPCGVYWQVGSSATIGIDNVFAGTILAYAAITLSSGATVYGRAIARTAALSMDTNYVSVAGCE